MTQSIKKTNRGDRIDRISDLPSNVIDGILEHLNIVELVSTGILSRKWRYKWMSVPKLDFNANFFSRFKNLDDPDPEISRIITEVLLLHNGPIYRFRLHIPYSSKIFAITTEYLNKWILFLSRRGIKDLELEDDASFIGSFYNKMPSHIFSCQELTRFRFSGFNLSVPPNFCGLKKLLDLHSKYCTYEFGALENLISGCPLLEKLNIQVSENMKSVCLRKSKNLIDLSLTVKQKRASGLIKSLPKIQRLTIDSFVTVKSLYADIIPPTQLISLKYLKLNAVDLDERGEVLYIVSVLKSVSDLVELYIQSRNKVGEQEPDRPEELECNSCCLSRLQTVNIIVGTSFKHALSLIRFILANSSSLKTLNFRVGFRFGYEVLDANVLLSISRDLLRMERASQGARVEFLHG